MAVFTFKDAIFKAKVRQPTKVEKLSKKKAGQISASLYSGIKTFRNNISPERLATAFETKDLGKITREISWDKGFESVAPAFEELGSHAETIAMISFDALPAPVQNNLRMDFKNPAYKRFLNTRFTDFLQDLNKDQMKTSQRYIQRAFTHGETPREVAENLINHIGLNDRQSIALLNYRMGLENSKMSKEKIDTLSERYSDTLLKQRATMIARTEIQNVNNQGQLSVWKAAQDEGLVDPEKTFKVWQNDTQPCPECAKMHGEKVPLNGKWLLGDGRTVSVPSEIHPSCYCYQILEF